MTGKAILLLIALLVFGSACTISAAPAPPPTIERANQPTAQPRPTRAPQPTPSLKPIQTPSWFRDVVLYEIMPISFYDSNGDGFGDLNGITQKLDYLKNLGVGALWLTPIFAASDDHHGYHTTDYYKINPKFGSEDDLIALVREAHQRNMRVLLDYVVAHTSNQHPFFKDALGNVQSKYADWYRWTNAEHTRYESFQAVAELPSLNHDNPDVQKYLIDLAKYWMQKANIDGFRCDYVLNVPHAFWKKLRAELKAINPDFLLLAEAWTKATDIATYYDGEFDATFDFPLCGDIEGSPDALGDSVLLGTRSPQLLDGTLVAEQKLFPPNAERVEFLNNHDTNRVMSEVKGNVSTDSAQVMQRAKLGADLLFTLPNTPMIYYGEEIGMSGVKSSAPDYDKTRREPMDWYASEYDAGMTTWYRPSLRNNGGNDGISVEEEQGKRNSLLEHYRALAQLRNANAALRTGSYERVFADEPSVYAYLRADAVSIFLVVLNVGRTAQALTLDLSATSLPDGSYTATEVFSKQTFDLSGYTLTMNAAAASGYIFQLTRR